MLVTLNLILTQIIVVNLYAVTHPTTNLLKDCLTSFYKIQNSTTELHNVNALITEILLDNNIKFEIKTTIFCECLVGDPSNY